MALSEIKIHSVEDEDVTPIRILSSEQGKGGLEKDVKPALLEASDSLGLGPALSILLRLDSNAFRKVSLMQHITRESKHLGTR